jgi:REP element-mobilizing transposase RayT
MEYKLHRNSQKRIYVNGGIYFITTNTCDSYPYFEYDILCDLFVEELSLCREVKTFELYAYKINPEHVHLLLQPGKRFNVSKIMQAVKKNFSQDSNKLLGHEPNAEGTNSNSRLRCVDLSKYRGKIKGKIPKFKWQKSYHDHIIRSRQDFYNHLKYIQNQWIKHDLPENKYCFVSQEVV